MSARPPLEAVLFDAGGTLVRIDFEWISAMLAELGLAIDAGTIRRAEVAGRRAYDRSVGGPREGGSPPLGGVGDTRAYFGTTLAAAGVPTPRLDEALARCFERHAATGLWTRPLEGARVAIDGLAALGLRLAVVSNSDGRAEMHLDDCDVRDGLEFVVDSHLVGVEKPDPGIFGHALDRLGVAAERTLFVGDILSVDAAGARAAGMAFVLVDPYGDYAPPGIDAIARLDDLPTFVSDHFTPVATAVGRTPTTRT